MGKKKTPKKGTRRTSGRAAEKKAAPKAKEEESVILPIEREFPEDEATFANHFVIQFDGPEFYLMFFQTRPLLLLGDPAEKKKQLEQMKAVKSRCVARIVMSARRVPDVIKAMQENLAKYHAAQETTDATRG